MGFWENARQASLRVLMSSQAGGERLVTNTLWRDPRGGLGELGTSRVPCCVCCLPRDASPTFSTADTATLILWVRTGKCGEVRSLARRQTASPCREPRLEPQNLHLFVSWMFPGFEGAPVRSP